MRPAAARRPAVTLARKIAFLGNPRSHAPRPARVTALQTHFAWVFLAGSYAYKLKKPARQAGMDYRTLAARRRGCEVELRLNRRLAPSVYLSVVRLTLQGRRLRLDGRGRTVDFLVKMRRLPATASLDRRLARGEVRARDLAPLVRRLADFYARARRRPLSSRDYLARFRTQMSRNLAALREARAHIDWARVLRVAGMQEDFLRRAPGTLGRRAARLVDAHGDLRAEHVCLRPLEVIDCLEFDRELRRLDPHEDVALLALEIERVRPALARAFLGRMAVALADPVPASLAHIYMCHRALTRAKLAAWHIGERQFPDPGPWIARADSLVQSAERHARRALRLAAGPLRMRALTDAGVGARS